MRKSVFLFLLSFFSVQLFAQVQLDTLQSDLEELVVVGYEGNRSILETAGSISFVSASTVSGLNNQSLLFGMNTIPGLKMEERAPGSYRVSIRGSSLRSPFGIRNVKVYWNGIPYTEPSGTTFLNLLDTFNMQSIEVIKGPSGSIYGAGNGGVLLINSTTPAFTDQLNSALTVGSFGSAQYNLGYQNQFDEGSISFKYANQTTDGYRDQSFLDRQTLELSGTSKYSEGRELSVNLLYSHLNYGIPGGLNADQFADDPTQARPGNAFALGSVEANSSILHESLLFGVTHETRFRENLSNKSSIFGTFSDFENPFIFDYKIDSRKSGGFRTVTNYNVNGRGMNADFTGGVEYQTSSYASRNYENKNTQPGDLNFDDELNVQAATLFFTSNIDLRNNWFINAGVSINDVGYDINRLYSNIEFDFTGKVEKNFATQVLPRLGLAKRLTDQITAHASISKGFSPPTLEEIRTNEGGLNLDLEAEEGTNLEVGLRGNALNARLMFDLVLFNYRLDESIVQVREDTLRDTPVFTNTGSATQNGIELSTSYLIIDSPTSTIRFAKINLAYTHHSFSFDEYITDENDFSGNEMTGVTPNNLVTSLFVETKPGLYGTFSYNFTDEIPLTDDNSVYSEAYHLVQTKIGYKASFFKGVQTDLYFGIDNLLDESYSLGYDINAFGGRYFQPAPERNWFMGVKVNWELGP